MFDSSAQFDGMAINSAPLTGPDLMNSLLGVLMQFRKEPVALTVDIQHVLLPGVRGPSKLSEISGISRHPK